MSLSNEDTIADATPYRCRTVISIINQGPDTFRFWETELRSRRGNARRMLDEKPEIRIPRNF